jgi:hypothetical protein
MDGRLRRVSVVHGFVGWALCFAMAVTTFDNALIAHAIGAQSTSSA